MSAGQNPKNQTTTFKWPKFEPCSKCGGGGMHYNGEDIMCCQACGGGGSVVARDERGRFLPWEVVNHVEQ
jgi:DnaJ-class molecular chaperone